MRRPLQNTPGNKSSAAQATVYRRIFTALRDGILLVDAKTGSITDCNPSIVAMLGITEARLRKKKIWEIGFLGGFLSSKAAYRRLKQGYASGNDRLAIRTGKGNRLDVELECTPFRVDGADGVQFTLRDITERRRLEAAVLEYEARFHRIFDNSHLGMAIISRDFRILKINRAFSVITGYDETEMNALALSDITHQSHLPSGKKMMRAVRRCTDENYHEETRFMGKRGDVVWVNVHLGAVCGDDRIPKYYQAVIENITDRKQVEAALAELNFRNLEKEKVIQKLKDEFVFIAAHELGAPVTSMNWAVELLKDAEAESGARSVDVMESVRIIDESAKRLKELVSELLEVSRIEYGTLRVAAAEFDLSAVIRPCVMAIGSAAKKVPITVMFAAPPKGTSAAFGDPILVREVLTNLLTNAVKYSPPGGVVTVRVNESAADLLVSVTDTGFGLSGDDIPKLFQRFSRITTDATKAITGTGLGLYIAKLVVERMGGMIWVESGGRGQGSTFTFSLPKVRR